VTFSFVLIIIGQDQCTSLLIDVQTIIMSPSFRAACGGLPLQFV